LTPKDEKEKDTRQLTIRYIRLRFLLFEYMKSVTHYLGIEVKSSL